MSNKRDQLVIQPLEGYNAVVSFAAQSLQKEREKTLKAVERLEGQHLDAYVDGFPNSIGTLLYHIADIELDWLYSEILEQDVPKELQDLFPIYTHLEDGSLAPVQELDLANHLNRMAVVRADLLKQLKGMTHDEFYRVRELPPYDVNPAWVMYHLLEHEAKHGEQIAHIRRVLGV